MAEYVTMAMFEKLSAHKRVENMPNPRCKVCNNVHYNIIDGINISVKKMNADEIDWHIKRDGDYYIMTSSCGFFPTDLVAGVVNRTYNENTELSQHTGYVKSYNTGSSSNCFKAERCANAIAILRKVGFNVMEV